jgi:hypothetical protein
VSRNWAAGSERPGYGETAQALLNRFQRAVRQKKASPGKGEAGIPFDFLAMFKDRL